MKKIIVTGHNGFIGTLLVKLLIENGYDILGIDTKYFGDDCLFYEQGYEINELKKDIRQLSEDDLEGAYAICHLAALSNDPLGEVSPELTLEINYEASVRLALLAKKVGVEKYIYSSSCSLYGISGGDVALNETAPFSPITAYAKSKVNSETSIIPLGDSNFSVTSLRNATAYGISPKLRVDLVVNNLVGWAVTSKKIVILSDGSPWRPLIHAEDIARAFIAVIEAPKEKVNRQFFNVGLNSENYQIKEIANLVYDIVPNCEVVITGEHGSDSRTYRVNFDKISHTLLNFKPRWNLKKGIEQIYENYLKYEMDSEKFGGRYFIRLKQLLYLIDGNKVDLRLYWKNDKT